MGDFGVDTAIEGADGRYSATLSPEWEIWGPCGGYVLAVALRAAGDHSRFKRPATLSCHFLAVADFGPVRLTTETLRAGKRSESIRVRTSQGDRAVCEAMVWTVDEHATGWEHDATLPPALPAPEEVPTAEDRLGDEYRPWYPFWNNVEYRPLEWLSEEERSERDAPLPPRWRCWVRYRPTPTFDDPFIEAARVALWFDVMGWPAASRAMPLDQEGRWMSPNMDVNVTFHQPPAGADYLFLDAEAPIARGGLVGALGRVWAPDGRLLAMGTEQMLCREVPPPGRE